MRVRLGVFTAEHNGLVSVPERLQSSVALPAVGTHRRSLGHVIGDERLQSGGAAPINDAQPQSPGVDELLEGHTAIVLLAVLRGTSLRVLALSNLNGSDNGGLMVNTVPFTARATTQKAFVDLYRMLATNGVGRDNHLGRSSDKHDGRW